MQYCTVPLLVCISGACCTLWREGIIWIRWQRGGATGRCGSGRWPAWMKCAQVSRSTTSCFVSKLVIAGRLLLVAAGCSLRVPLPSLTAIENSRQGSPFPSIRHEQEKSIHIRKTRFNDFGGQETWYKEVTWPWATNKNLRLTPDRSFLLAGLYCPPVGDGFNRYTTAKKNPTLRIIQVVPSTFFPTGVLKGLKRLHIPTDRWFSCEFWHTNGRFYSCS